MGVLIGSVLQLPDMTAELSVASAEPPLIVMIHASRPWDFNQGVDILGISEMAAGASFRHYFHSVAHSAHALSLTHTHSLNHRLIIQSNSGCSSRHRFTSLP